MSDCPKCGGEVQCLGGESAHPDNWYCADEENCGWKAWVDRGTCLKTEPKLFTQSEVDKVLEKHKSAIEHGEYLAHTAETFMRELNSAAIDGGGYEATEEISDCWSGLASDIYEFRKRANRVNAKDTGAE